MSGLLCRHGEVNRPSLSEIRAAAERAGVDEFVDLLRWYRAVAGLSEKDWGSEGSFRVGVDELDDRFLRRLLGDLNRIARNKKHRRRALDGKPTFARGVTLGELRERRSR